MIVLLMMPVRSYSWLVLHKSALFWGEEGAFMFLFNVFCCSIVSALFSELWNQRQVEINQVIVFGGSVCYGGPESSPQDKYVHKDIKQKNSEYFIMLYFLEVYWPRWFIH